MLSKLHFGILHKTSLQLKIRVESAFLTAMESLFHSLGARREKSLGRMEPCPGCFREGSDSFLVLNDLSEQEVLGFDLADSTSSLLSLLLE